VISSLTRRTVIVEVIATVIVAVHVNGNATVIVIRPVDGNNATTRRVVDERRMLSFQKLDVYQRSIEFLAFARRLLQRIPKGHSDLVDQLRRSAQSIPQNIAEGAGKTGRADKARYYAIARGSAMESAAHLDVMKIDELIDDEHYTVGVGLLERVVAMLTKMIDP
jgi:four helix bundle protein